MHCKRCSKSMNTAPQGPEAEAPRDECDITRRYVRVLQHLPNGLVSFEFAIGWPELSVELMLPPADFEAFCARNAVLRLDEAPPNGAMNRGDKHP